MPRVLHVISDVDPRAGGPITALLGLCRAQRDVLNQSVSIVSTYRKDADFSHVETLRDARVSVELVGPATGALARHRDLVPTLARAIEQVDVVHIHGLWEEAQHQAARLADGAGTPYIIRPCGMLDPWCLNQSKWKKKIYMSLRLRHNLQRASAMHFTTEIERELVAPLHLKPKAIVEPNGVDLAEFETLPEPGSFRAEYPELGDRPILLFLSRIHHKKGLDLLVPAFAKIRNQDAMLVIAGPDSPDGYRSQVEEMVREHGVGDRVLFTGMLHGRERIRAYTDAALFVLPSYQENFGIVVIEALATGTPVVISDQVNLHREVSSNRIGAVVPTEVNALTQALDAWIGDESMRHEAAQRARPFVMDNYDWVQISRRWAEHYRALLNQSASSVPG
ncbi:MAG: glycosyltransferase [Phycisphaerales bacterium]|nr:MAG: glycosyltransferase [Phycisphaerales bacterium]